MENVRKYRDIKLVTTKRRRNYLVSKLNYHTTKFFTENLLAIEMEKTQVLMNKPVYLRLLVLNIDSFIVHVKTDDIYKDITEAVETWFDTTNDEIDRPLPIRKNKQLIGLMKDELGGKIMKTNVGIKAKTYSYLKDNDDKYKKAKGVEK